MSRPTAPTWRDLRTTSGLTLRQLEELTRINRGDLSRIERGRLCPTPDQSLTLLHVFHPDLVDTREHAE
jgi:transcriptional regulator with XRE-family HTH domain